MVPPSTSQRRPAMSRAENSHRQGPSASTTLLHSSSVTVVCRATGQRLRIVNHHVCYAHDAVFERVTAIGQIVIGHVVIEQVVETCVQFECCAVQVSVTSYCKPQNTCFDATILRCIFPSPTRGLPSLSSKCRHDDVLALGELSLPRRRQSIDLIMISFNREPNAKR